MASCHLSDLKTRIRQNFCNYSIFWIILWRRFYCFCRNVPPARPKRPESLVKRQNSSAGAAPPNKPPPPAKPSQTSQATTTASESSSSFQEQTQLYYANEDQSTSDTQPTYANEKQPKKALLPKGWSPAVKFQPQSPNSESSSISFQDGDNTQGSHDNADRVPVKALKPPVQTIKPTPGVKPPVPAAKPPVNRTPSNPGAKPPVARKPKVTRTTSDC